jgi:hypothetical protein
MHDYERHIDERLHAIAGLWETFDHVIGEPRTPSSAPTSTKCWPVGNFIVHHVDDVSDLDRALAG